MLKMRIITACVGLPLVILAVWFDTPLPWFTILICLIAILGVREFYRLTGVHIVTPLMIFGVIFTLLLVLEPLCTYRYALPVLLIASIIVGLGIVSWRDALPGRYIRLAWMMLGALYVGWLLSLFVYLRMVPGTESMPELGRNLVFLALFVTFGSDTFAYFVGKTIGRHLMAPRVSPKKTWEGAIGGFAGAVLISWLFTLDWPLHLSAPLWQALTLGAGISIFGQIGDLAESLLKRVAGVKDSGNLMPGHGGILDRIDSILPAGAVIYLFYFLVFA